MHMAWEGTDCAKSSEGESEQKFSRSRPKHKGTYADHAKASHTSCRTAALAATRGAAGAPRRTGHAASLCGRAPGVMVSRGPVTVPVGSHRSYPQRISRD